jgi:hypothetical protein
VYRSCSSTIPGVPTSPSGILQPARPPTRSKLPGLPSAVFACAVLPRRGSLGRARRGSAKRLMPVCEWHWALTSALSRKRYSRWGYGFAARRVADAERPRHGAGVRRRRRTGHGEWASSPT